MNAHFASLRRGARLGRLIASVHVHDRGEVIRDFVVTYARVGAALVASPQRALRELAANVGCMFRMLVDRRFRVSWGTTAAIVFALAYFVSPVDLIPDTIPVIGFLDDAALVAEIALLIANDIRRFRVEGAAPPAVIAVAEASPVCCAPRASCAAPLPDAAPRRTATRSAPLAPLGC